LVVLQLNVTKMFPKTPFRTIKVNQNNMLSADFEENKTFSGSLLLNYAQFFC